MARASHGPSPAPMSTPSTTKTKPESGWPSATTTSPPAIAACTAGSGEKSGPSHGRSRITSTPSTTPTTMPHRTTRVVASRVRSTSPAPRALPVIACAAMASASRAKARKVQIVAVTW